MTKLKWKLIEWYALLCALLGLAAVIAAVVCSLIEGVYWITALYGFILPVPGWLVFWLGRKVFWPKNEDGPPGSGSMSRRTVGGS